MSDADLGTGAPAPPGAPASATTGSDGREADVLRRIDLARRRKPRLRDTVITLAHGAGGKASASLVEALFRPAFAEPAVPSASDAANGSTRDPSGAHGSLIDDVLTDAALLTLPSGERLAFTTDSFVVRPRRFPGGSIGHLAVHGTVNDLAVMGAKPRWLSAAFVLQEGLAVEELRAIAADMGAAARQAGVQLVTGDTKVVDRGSADGLYITTAGIGLVPAGAELGAHLVRPGDQVLVSGTIGDHGMAVMLARGDLALDAPFSSDTAPLTDLVAALLAAAPSVRWMRDPTRGGVGTVCNELAHDTQLAVVLDEADIPVAPAVGGACDILGIDPLYVANEGKLVAVVPPEQADAALAAMRRHPLGTAAARIGDIRDDPPGIVVLRTAFGGTRIVDMLVGDPLPRIC